jgi:protein involved in polysaccharide export with SLBB domain
MTAKRIWLAALLVVFVMLIPAVSFAETAQVSRTDALIALIRQATAQQYQIAPQDVLIVGTTRISKLSSPVWVSASASRSPNRICTI